MRFLRHLLAKGIVAQKNNVSIFMPPLFDMHPLFKKYTHAFNALDGKAIASLYNLPCTISDADGTYTYHEFAALEQKFQQNCRALKGMQYDFAQYHILNSDQHADDKVSVILAWRVHLQKQSSPIDFHTRYLCQLKSNQWTILKAEVFAGEFVEKSDALN